MYSYPLYPTSISDSLDPNSPKIETVFQIIDKRTIDGQLPEDYEYPSITGFPTYSLSLSEFYDNIINAQSIMGKFFGCRSKVEQMYDGVKDCYHVHILLLDNPKEEEPPTESTPEEGTTDGE